MIEEKKEKREKEEQKDFNSLIKENKIETTKK